ncbi:uncharacterized protein N7459_009026 [Penicillium hispanicum]|uniref:uncharacterized protein n=1 Tax=Penicillium hispanicum TaxID=1080232 RepID=UPI002540FA5D|nr:uncharacterized protein N7459_009026 [Penicillium hispanicum]KAJ5569596.1 hypothetical protein N7459_009026 [Penicillium hispanicum]
MSSATCVPLSQLPSSMSIIDRIPNEVLLQILEELPALCLIALVPVSRRFQSLINYTLENRIRRFFADGEFILLLDWYEPAKQGLSPYYKCQYLGTDELDCTLNDMSFDNTHTSHQERPTALFSRYRPEPMNDEPEDESLPGRIKLMGDVGCVKSNFIHMRKEEIGKCAISNVALENDEDFTQFIVRLEMAMQPGPDQAYTRSMLMHHKSFIRINREWLKRQADGAEPQTVEENEKICWIDDSMTFGLKMAVRKFPDIEPTSIARPRHEMPEIFEITLKEFYIRPTALLVASEAYRLFGHDSQCLNLFMRATRY